MKRVDMTGERYGLLTVTDKFEIRDKRTWWLCKCECGNEKYVVRQQLIRGETRSCGCVTADLKIENYKGEGEKYKVLSLGWGVQSFTLAAMAALGAIEKPDVVLHAYTPHEHQHTYEFMDRWSGWLIDHGVNLVNVTCQRKDGTQLIIDGTKTHIPAFSRGKFGIGKINRQCTNYWKIVPVNKYIQSHRYNKPVDVWLGISSDEKQRANPAKFHYMTHVFPLLDLGMSRNDCIAWLNANDIEVPKKSSCVFCPYHNKASWQDMKRENGSDWQTAIAVDRSIRSIRNGYELYIHHSCKPLEDVIVLPEDYTIPLEVGGGADAIGMQDGCDSGHCFI